MDHDDYSCTLDGSEIRYQLTSRGWYIVYPMIFLGFYTSPSQAVVWDGISSINSMNMKTLGSQV